MDDDQADATANTRWLSYSELADVRGISRESAVRIARRNRWRRRTANDGTVRVAVPRSILEAKNQDRPDNPAVDTPVDTEGHTPGQNSIIKALGRQIEALQGQLRAIEAHNATLQQQASDLRAERDHALERLAELEARLAQQEEASAPETGLSDEVLAAISEDLEHEGQQPWVEEAWGAYDSNDQSTAADPVHQVEQLWQRIAELEARLAEQTAPAPDSELSDEVLAAISADLEQDAPLEETAKERPGAGQGTAVESLPSGKLPRRRWWRWLLRRRAALEG